MTWPWRWSRRRVASVVLGAVVLMALAIGAPWARRLCEQPVSVRSAMQSFAQAQEGSASAGSGQTDSQPVSGGPGRFLNQWLARLTLAAVELKDQDALAYPAHVVLAEGLERFDCAPDAVALQWLKAGSHARGADQAARAFAGVVRQAPRAGGAAALQTRLYQFVDRQSGPWVDCTLGVLGDIEAVTDGGTADGNGDPCSGQAPLTPSD